jgi:dimethylaniline monooxygenase (N-oxide forming)
VKLLSWLHYLIHLERMYDSFWTQTVLGMAEFSDRPLVLPDDEETYYGFFPARHITEYLENYVDDHVYFGMSLRDRIMFDCQVMEVAQEGSLWHVTTSKGEFVTPRLIVATGLTSSPNMPALPETKDFGSRIIHQKEYGEWSATDSENVKHVAVLGGGKSAADIVYGCVKDGKQVAWIIRKDGGGPAAFVPAKGSGLYKNSNELLYNPLASCISPSIFPGQSYLAKFLNNTNAGSKVCERIWGLIDAQYRKVADYWRFDGKENGFHDLEPDDK